MSFTKKIEDFTCEHCGASVVGDGYTNHCPKCLWSKHVDVSPGDRMNTCKGLMQPIGLERDHGEQILIHQCQKCGQTARNKIAKNDDIDTLISLAKENASP